MTIVPVLCRGCGRTCSWAKDKYHKVFCAPWCAAEPEVGSNEERDDLIALLFHRGWTADHLVKKFGITRQRTYQIVKERLNPALA